MKTCIVVYYHFCNKNKLNCIKLIQKIAKQKQNNNKKIGSHNKLP